MTTSLQRSLALSLAAALALTGACGDDGTGPSVDLSGSYQLQSVTFPGQQPLTPPAAEGTLVLTQTTYNVNITIAGNPPQQVSDQGTYSTSGSTWTQESSVNGSQAVGNFTLSGNQLTVNTTLQGLPVVSVWLRS